MRRFATKSSRTAPICDLGKLRGSSLENYEAPGVFDGEPRGPTTAWGILVTGGEP